MSLKITIPIFIAFIFISGVAAYGITSGNIENYLFDQIPYNYTSHIWIPPNSDKGGSLGGFYTIQGQGREFSFHMVLPGAEGPESPLDYTSSGLDGTGKINSIHVTYNTINALLSKDLKKAMFGTIFNGTYNMSCAAWVGNGTFSNEGNGNLFGTFQINGLETYWEGNFTMKPEGNRIAVNSDYIWYPNKSPQNAKRVQKVNYM